jgi:hypothetical protein
MDSCCCLVREDSKEEVPAAFFDAGGGGSTFLFDSLLNFLLLSTFLVSALFDLFLYFSSSLRGLREILKSRLNFGTFRVEDFTSLSLLLTHDFSIRSTSDDASDFPATDLRSLSAATCLLRSTFPFPEDKEEEQDGDDEGQAITGNTGLKFLQVFGRSNSSVSEPDRPFPGDLLNPGGGSGGFTGSFSSVLQTRAVHWSRSGSLEPSGCFLDSVSMLASFSSTLGAAGGS